MTSLIISLAVGLLWGLLFRFGMGLAGYEIELPVMLLGSLAFGGAMFVFIQWTGRKQKRRALQAAQKLPSPLDCSCMAVLGQGRAAKAVAVFLCENGMYLCETDRKDLPLTAYASEDFLRAVCPSPHQLELHLTEDRTILLNTGASEALLERIKQLGWLPFQH